MPYQFHLFGAASPVGEAFKRGFSGIECDSELFVYSRKPSDQSSNSFFADLTKPWDFVPAGSFHLPSIWVSFAPIWLFSPFLEYIRCSNADHLSGLRYVIVSSSSSAITKRFSMNSFDKDLAVSLCDAENNLLSTCRNIGIACNILQPTLVYGRVGNYCDQNFSRLLKLLSKSYVLPVPKQSGFRQPIHASQLASVSLHLSQQLIASAFDPVFPERVALGGDTTITYVDMIRALQQSQPPGNAAGRCRLLPISNRLFFLLAVPLLLISPKAFEAVLRIAANLSGFTPSHKLLGSKPQPFPVLPLA